jgi:hypothetical protein
VRLAEQQAEISILVPALLRSEEPGPVLRPDSAQRPTRRSVRVLPRPRIFGTAALAADFSDTYPSASCAKSLGTPSCNLNLQRNRSLVVEDSRESRALQDRVPHVIGQLDSSFRSERPQFQLWLIRRSHPVEACYRWHITNPVYNSLCLALHFARGDSSHSGQEIRTMRRSDLVRELCPVRHRWRVRRSVPVAATLPVQIVQILCARRLTAGSGALRGNRDQSSLRPRGTRR